MEQEFIFNCQIKPLELDNSKFLISEDGGSKLIIRTILHLFQHIAYLFPQCLEALQSCPDVTNTVFFKMFMENVYFPILPVWKWLTIL